MKGKVTKMSALTKKTTNEFISIAGLKNKQ